MRLVAAHVRLGYHIHTELETLKDIIHRKRRSVKIEYIIPILSWACAGSGFRVTFRCFGTLRPDAAVYALTCIRGSTARTMLFQSPRKPVY